MGMVTRYVTASAMMTVIARAQLASGRASADQIMSYVRGLTPRQLVKEFHRSVAMLSSQGLLSASEEATFHLYAEDHLNSGLDRLMEA